MMSRTVIIDLDGTLADCEHRKHHIADKDNRNWDAFHEAIPKDGLNSWCAHLMELLSNSGIIITIVTARPEKYRAHTIEWLQRHGVRYDNLFMRPADDYRNDEVIKEEFYHLMLKDRTNILFVVDDRNKVVDMWRKNGLICLQPYPGDF